METRHRTRPQWIPSALHFQQLVFILFLLLAGNGAGHAAPLHLRTGFDNDHLDVAQSGTRYLEVLVTASESASRSGRVPLNLALVIDTSGSMSEAHKLDYVKEAACAILDRLRPEDRFAIVAYNSQVRVLFPSQPVGHLHHARMQIDSLRSGGGTNWGAGLLEGYRQLQEFAGPTTINRVMLLSDGIANAGITSSFALSQIVLEQSDGGISLSTFGVGLDFNEDLLATLSESGRGMYYFIDHPESMHSILAREFNAVERLAVADVKVTITLRFGLVIDKVFANNFEIDGNTVSVRFGDLAAGERRRLQVRLRTHHQRVGLNNKAAQVAVSYLLPGRDRSLSLSQRLGLTYTGNAHGLAAHRDAGISERSAFFEAHYARGEAAKAFDRGDVGTARALLDATREKIVSSGVSGAKVDKAISAIDVYRQSLNTQLRPGARALEQKRIKHRSYAIEGC